MGIVAEVFNPCSEVICVSFWESFGETVEIKEIRGGKAEKFRAVL
jgi:hypothetical protein